MPLFLEFEPQYFYWLSATYPNNGHLNHGYSNITRNCCLGCSGTGRRYPMQLGAHFEIVLINGFDYVVMLRVRS